MFQQPNNWRNGGYGGLSMTSDSYPVARKRSKSSCGNHCIALKECGGGAPGGAVFESIAFFVKY
jgi:hypothetical protein